MATRPETREPNYLRPLLARALEIGRDPKYRGRVFTEAVYHDDWCDQLAGRGPCNCEPEIGEPVLWPREDAGGDTP
jgi:hypothetical protein